MRIAVLPGAQEAQHARDHAGRRRGLAELEALHAESSLEHGLIDAVHKRPDLKPALGRILRLCAGGSLVPIEPGEAAPPPGVVARVLRFLRTRPHGDAHTNGGAA